MLKFKNKLGIAVITAFVVAAVAVPAANAKSVKFHIVSTQKCKNATDSNNVCAKVVGKVSAGLKGTYTADLSKIPNLTYNLKVKGGTLTLKAVTALSGSGVKGKWTVSKGTGKYKKAKGKGTLTGSLTGVGGYNFKGSIS